MPHYIIKESLKYDTLNILDICHFQQNALIRVAFI